METDLEIWLSTESRLELSLLFGGETEFLIDD